jgi:hypothetical protein
MRRLLLLLLTLVLASAVVGGAAASAPGTQHAVFSNNWQGITFVGGLDTCPVFGDGIEQLIAPPYSYYVFRDVDLTDQINEAITPVTPEPLAHFKAVATLHGVINTLDGAYTVTGGAFKEDRVGSNAPWYFTGTGRATISGPGGTVVGKARFTDLTSFPPQEFDLLFTSITACHLK